MPKPTSILYDPDIRKSMDYTALRKEGIKYAQQMSGDIWTDYNEHDPGITILEQFCYALTDIAFRTNLNVEKLLFSGADYKEVSEANALYEPNEIVPCWPFTISDYRIYIIDDIPEVINAWIFPVKPSDTKHNINGLFNVVLKVANDVHNNEYSGIIHKVRALFAERFRNIGEDINEIKVLKPLPIEISLNIDIASDAIGEQVLSEIYYKINNYFNPVVRFYTYEELKEEGYNLFDIFETPSFRHGFIKKEELMDHRVKMLIPQVNEIIGKIPGVRIVRECILKKNGLRVYGDALEIGNDFFVTLENVKPDLKSPPEITITRAGMNYEHDPGLTIHLFEMKLAKEKRSYDMKAAKGGRERTDKTSLKDHSTFSSIQNTLPSVYGVGTYGLPGDANQKRIAQSKQLKGYLYFFDQIMANHLAQLEKIRDLFSVKTTDSQSYYGKLPVNLAPMEDLFQDFSDDMINDLLKGFDHFAERKNKILDHLLSRFGEKFDMHLTGHFKSLFGNLDKNEIKKQLINLKVEFLESFRQISRRRAQALNYGKPSWNTDDNILSFRKRVYLLLNIKDYRQRSLVDHHFGDHKVDPRKLDSKEIKRDIIADDETSYTYTDDSSFKYTFLVKGKNALEYLLTHGYIESNYHLARVDESLLVLFQAWKKDAPVKVCEVDDLEDGKKVIRQLAQYFRRVNELSEGFHAIEHILLRPLAPKEYDFEVLGESDEVIFINHGSLDIDKQKERAQQALLAACHRSNYRADEQEGKYTITIHDDHGEILMTSVSDHADLEAGPDETIEKFIKYFKKLDRTITAMDRKVNFTVLSASKIEVDKDFFYSKMSIVLPDWIARFQSSEFKMLLRNVIGESIPAHISVDFIWFSRMRMKEFESAYKKWLKAKLDYGTSPGKQDKLSAQLINLLIRKNNE